MQIDITSALCAEVICFTTMWCKALERSRDHFYSSARFLSCLQHSFNSQPQWSITTSLLFVPRLFYLRVASWPCNHDPSICLT